MMYACWPGVHLLLEQLCLGDMFLGSNEHSSILIVPWLSVNGAQEGGDDEEGEGGGV